MDSFITSLYCLAEHCEYGVLEEVMIRDRYVVKITNTSLSLKLQMDCALTVKQSIDMGHVNTPCSASGHGLTKRTRQKGTVLFKKYSSNADVVQGQWARKPNKKHSQWNQKRWTKVQDSKQITKRKCDRCWKSPDHHKPVTQPVSSAKRWDTLV